MAEAQEQNGIQHHHNSLHQRRLQQQPNNPQPPSNEKPINKDSGHSSKGRGGGSNSNHQRGRNRKQPQQQRGRLQRQDSALSDCSDCSGLSEYTGISSVSSQNSGSDRGQQLHHHWAHPPLNYSSQSNNNNNNNNNACRGMYARQDSGRSFSSASSGTTYSSDESISSSQKFMHNYKKPVMPPKSQYVALDCEMVGTLTGKSLCARVVLIDWKGRTMLDEYVKPTETVTDYRTFVSGITAEQIKDAPTLEQVRPMVQSRLSGKILVGHGLANDLECLGVEHPWHMIRDTALYEPFMKMHYGQLNPRKLKELAKEKLQRDIQAEGLAHSPAEDAIAALDLYKSHRPRWEACMNSQIKEGQRLLVEQHKQREQYEQYFAGLPVLAFAP